VVIRSKRRRACHCWNFETSDGRSSKVSHYRNYLALRWLLHQGHLQHCGARSIQNNNGFIITVNMNGRYYKRRDRRRYNVVPLAARNRPFSWLWPYCRLIPMKIGSHGAFSMTQRALRTSLPGAPNKFPHQSDRMEKKTLASYRVQGLRIRGGNASHSREKGIFWRIVLYMQGNLHHPTQ
jgi:hypothetical protein